jgi:hypothetical protein
MNIKLIENYIYIMIGSQINENNFYELNELAIFSPISNILLKVPEELKNINGIKLLLKELNLKGLILYNNDNNNEKIKIRKILKDGFNFDNNFDNENNNNKKIIIKPETINFINLNHINKKFQNLNLQFYQINKELKDKEKIKIMTYNILSPLTLKKYRYKYTDDKNITFDYRKENLLLEISYYLPDILCLQEISHFDTFWNSSLLRFDYNSIYFTNQKESLSKKILKLIIKI